MITEVNKRILASNLTSTTTALQVTSHTRPAKSILADDLASESRDLAVSLVDRYLKSGALNASSEYRQLTPLFKTLDDLVCLTITEEKRLASQEKRLASASPSKQKKELERSQARLNQLKETIEFYKVNFIEPFAETLSDLGGLDQNLIKRFIDIVIKANLSRISQNGDFESYKSKLEDLFKSFNYEVSQKPAKFPN
jgi:hypothetical protein